MKEMSGLRIINPHSNALPFILLFVVLILFFPAFSIAVNTLLSTESLTISSNRTIVSLGDVFELGFFKPSPRPRWYLGMWNKKVPQRAYLWVANRDTPLSNSVGTLKISESNLVLLDHSDTVVWSTNRTRDKRLTVVAELLDNGNFVLRDSITNNNHEFLWQSFDYPTDTLLPQMKLGRDLTTGLSRSLTSWRSPDDPSSGYFSYKLETRGLPEFYLFNRGSPIHRSGPWDGIRFSGIPEVLELNYMVYNFTDTREDVAYTFQMTDPNIHSVLTLGTKGTLDRFIWMPTSWNWELFWFSPKDGCDMYKMCGPYSYCDTNTPLLCNCIKGFVPLDQQRWEVADGSDGCTRRTFLSCSGDRFHRLKKMKLPDTTSVVVDRKIGLKDCKKMCLKDCNCTAFANTDIRNGGRGCVIWNGELVDIRNYPAGGQDLYVRLASSEIADERKMSGDIIGLIVGVSLLFLLSFILFYFWKRKQKLSRAMTAPNEHQDRHQRFLMDEVVVSSSRHLSRENSTDDLELRLMEFEDIVKATENFSDSNRLGRGGFGVVYKGNLLDGQEIAVKRLSKTSAQGVTEFKNEVKLIARLQHINLVRLLGCCIEVDEKMLIYEYLENLSLDSYLFDKTQSYKLDWQKRFDITNGIARGILYLHQDSRCKIIHRDLKASNILLDKDMTPKISDFGMARIFGREDTEAITRKVVGTYGYMSPEYAMDGIFSMKSDVFSFGVLLLEIISGKRNTGFYNSNHDLNLLACVWRNWEEGKGIDIVDPIITESISSSSSSTFRPQEVLRCIQIGLLCVQERAEDRPTMSSVVMMLGSETGSIPWPKPPGYCVGRSPLKTDSSSGKQQDEEFLTVNQITISVINSR